MHVCVRVRACVRVYVSAGVCEFVRTCGPPRVSPSHPSWGRRRCEGREHPSTPGDPYTQVRGRGAVTARDVWTDPESWTSPDSRPLPYAPGTWGRQPHHSDENVSLHPSRTDVGPPYLPTPQPPHPVEVGAAVDRRSGVRGELLGLAHTPAAALAHGPPAEHHGLGAAFPRVDVGRPAVGARPTHGVGWSARQASVPAESKG